MKIQEILQAAQDELMKAIDGVSSDDAETCLVEKNWTIRDVTANLCAYEHMLGEILSSRLVESSGAPYLFQFRTMGKDKFDEFHRDEYKVKPFPEIVSELTSRHKYILGMSPQLTEDLLDEKGVLPWFEQNANVKDYLMKYHLPQKKYWTEKISECKKKLEIMHKKPSKRPDL